MINTNTVRFGNLYESYLSKMSESEYKFRVPFNVRSYEVDHHQEASISAICNYFQEAAGLHAHELQFDISDLQEKGLTWILYKLQVKVYRFPKRWESVEVCTWPSTGDGLRAYRDYELFDDHGDLLAAGLSQWMVLDIKRRRPVKMPEELMSSRFKTDQHVLELHKNNLPKVNSDKSQLITIANKNDLDMNQHVNNVRYIDWITGYPLSDKKCTEIVIQYAAETKADDQIYLSSEANKTATNEVDYTLYKNETKSVIANAKTIWESPG